MGQDYTRGWPISDDVETVPSLRIAHGEDGSIKIPPLRGALESLNDGSYNPYRYSLDYYGGYILRQIEKSPCFEDPSLRKGLEAAGINQCENRGAPVIISDYFSYYELGLLNAYLLEPKGTLYDRARGSITDGVILAEAQRFTVDWMKFIRNPQHTAISSAQLELWFQSFTHGESFHYAEEPFQHLCTLDDLYKSSLLNLYISHRAACNNTASCFYESIYTCILSHYLRVSPDSVFEDEFGGIDDREILEDYLGRTGAFLEKEL